MQPPVPPAMPPLAPPVRSPAPSPLSRRDPPRLEAALARDASEPLNDDPSDDLDSMDDDLDNVFDLGNDLVKSEVETGLELEPAKNN